MKQLDFQSPPFSPSCYTNFAASKKSRTPGTRWEQTASVREGSECVCLCVHEAAGAGSDFGKGLGGIRFQKRMRKVVFLN